MIFKRTRFDEYVATGTTLSGRKMKCVIKKTWPVQCSKHYKWQALIVEDNKTIITGTLKEAKEAAALYVGTAR